MVDRYDNDPDKVIKNSLIPLNKKEKSSRQVAVALQDAPTSEDVARITAAGRGKIAEQILQIAFENGVNVREDGALAEMLATIELDSPIPSEAFMAVAEILSYVYQANGQPNPFDSVLDDAMQEGCNKDDKNE
ncbi:MAG: EscU/YscU/HrcU family type III secretion system export apparatus switch protein [Micavibrio aeruginosavorus]|uniref:EscU/YscU/HrcU family type III secretion system export apparatus switch protein n=1 Tax=Micavibrio aeruginosavorus TaxID=349221 RepID=A0A7T5R1K3_9BACT|nr:MAG: EscU/YscU/HrcU family type III secretion system export apparatus switch protein [Micavibrio aeruginosavorus]